MNKNYKLLEYDKILDKIEKNIKLIESIDILRDETLYSNKNALEKEFKILDDTINFYKYDIGFDISAIFSMTDILKNLNIFGTYLSLEEIVSIHKNILTYRISKNRVKNLKDKYKDLYQIFDMNIDIKSLEKIFDEILDDNELKDTASIGLRDIRYQKNITMQNIKEKINDIFNNKDLQKAVSDKILTIRNERYVIAVKTDFKGLIKGIEHDRSSSGATTFIEPLNTVSLNNKLREYEAREREEIRKILMRVTEILRQDQDTIKNIFNILINIDILNAKTIFALENDCSIPKIVNKEYINLYEARHPLIDKEKVVPLSFSIGDDDKNILLITGPNTGGKTIALKTAGLLTLMSLKAIPIPASEKTEIGMFNNILVDIGDEQSIEQNLSSFSAHVTSIANIVNEATNKSLIILDEIGSGTDPIEGSSFAMAVIEYLKEQKSKVLVSTHYSELKYHSINDEKIKTSSMEFDINTLMPTYNLIVGIPGESNALIIAEKYGIKREIIDKAKSFVSNENQKVENIIIDLKKQTKELEETRDEIFKIKEENEKLKQEFEDKINQLEIEKNNIIEKAHKEADEYMKTMQNKVKNMLNKISTEEKNKNELKNIQKNINMIRESILMDKKEKINNNVSKNVDINFELGEEVFVKSINQKATILRIINDKHSLQVQAGILKMVVSVDDVIKVQKQKQKKINISSGKQFKEVKSEIDVRGMFAEDAIYDIEKYLDRAVLNNYTKVYIIHGKGTMVLRKKIWDYLKKCKYAKSYENATQAEGGLGCTVVYL